VFYTSQAIRQHFCNLTNEAATQKFSDVVVEIALCRPHYDQHSVLPINHKSMENNALLAKKPNSIQKITAAKTAYQTQQRQHGCSLPLQLVGFTAFFATYCTFVHGHKTGHATATLRRNHSR
jgi:microcompartment protein CcmL/EutN